MRAPIHDFHVSNLLTYGALAAAVAAVALAFDAEGLHLAAAAIGVAAIADTFDGRFARLFRRTPRQARCGKEIDSLVDAVILSGAAETEHYEIAVYEGLITHAGALGHDDVVSLLEENLEIEQHTLEEVKKATEQVAQQTAGRAA